MELLLIVAVVVIIILISNKKKDGLAAAEADLLAPELIDLLQRLRNFLNVNHFERDFLVMLIPINSGREPYANDSCYVQVSLALYNDEIRILKSADELDTEKYQWYGEQFFDKKFYFSEDLHTMPIGIQQCGNDAFYISFTNNTFSSEYKRLMKALTPKITAAFPDIDWGSNGSLISTMKFHQ